MNYKNVWIIFYFISNDWKSLQLKLFYKVQSLPLYLALIFVDLFFIHLNYRLNKIFLNISFMNENNET